MRSLSIGGVIVEFTQLCMLVYPQRGVGGVERYSGPLLAFCECNSACLVLLQRFPCLLKSNRNRNIIKIKLTTRS